MTEQQLPTCDLEEAALILKVHTRTVERLIHDGILAAGKVGRSWVLMREDVVAHVRKQITQQHQQRLASLGVAAKAFTPRSTRGRRRESNPASLHSA